MDIKKSIRYFNILANIETIFLIIAILLISCGYSIYAYFNFPYSYDNSIYLYFDIGFILGLIVLFYQLLSEKPEKLKLGLYASLLIILAYYSLFIFSLIYLIIKAIEGVNILIFPYILLIIANIVLLVISMMISYLFSYAVDSYSFIKMSDKKAREITKLPITIRKDYILKFNKAYKTYDINEIDKIIIFNKNEYYISKLETRPIRDFFAKVGRYALIIISLGFLYPKVKCKEEARLKSQTKIDNYNLYFTGDPYDLFKQWLKYTLLTILTLGIYLFFVSNDVIKWKAKNTHIKGAIAKDSYYDGNTFIQFLLYLGLDIINIITLFIAVPLTTVIKERYYTSHLVYDNKRLTFTGTAKELYDKYLIWLLLTYLTLGIYYLFLDSKLRKWKARNTHYIANIGEFRETRFISDNNFNRVFSVIRFIIPLILSFTFLTITSDYYNNINDINKLEIISNSYKDKNNSEIKGFLDSFNDKEIIDNKVILSYDNDSVIFYLYDNDFRIEYNINNSDISNKEIKDIVILASNIANNEAIDFYIYYSDGSFIYDNGIIINVDNNIISFIDSLNNSYNKER